MVFFKNVLLLLLLCLIPIAGNAALIGGHDRQRLSLIFFDILDTHFILNPIGLNLPKLPIIIHQDTPNAQLLLPLLTVLVEEGLLESHKVTVNAAEQGPQLKMTTAMEFSYIGNQKSQKVSLGIINLTEIKGFSELGDELGTQHQYYEVIFGWQLLEPKDWLWAPTLNSIKDIVYLREATQVVKTGRAQFKWLGDQWHLQGTPSLKTIQK